MKTILLAIIAFTVIAASAMAQVSNPSVIAVSTAPSGVCSAPLPLQLKTPDGTLYSCQNGTWGTSGGGITWPSPVVDKGGQVFNVKAYGAVGDGTIISDGAVTAGSTTFTSASSTFTTADTGKKITVPMGPQGIYSAVTTASASVTGSTAQYCTATISGSGSTASAVGYLYLTSTNTIASGGIVYIQNAQYGSGFTSTPATATLTNGTATCTGTVAITPSLFALPVTTTVTYASATTLTMDYVCSVNNSN